MISEIGGRHTRVHRDRDRERVKLKSEVGSEWTSRGWDLCRIGVSKINSDPDAPAMIGSVRADSVSRSSDGTA